MQVDFYHLTVSPMPRTLARIAERIIGDGGRLLVVHGDPEQRRTLDRDLWTYASDSFLPHAQVGEGDNAAQPVLLSGIADPLNGARNVAIVDGAWRDEALSFGRAFHFFDDDAIVVAREAWRALADKPGVERRYWKQTERGGWQQAA